MTSWAKGIVEGRAGGQEVPGLEEKTDVDEAD